MPRKTDREPPIPAAARPAHDAIVALTDAFCREHLNAEYEALCRKLAAALARKRPSPLARGKPEVWACAVVRVIGWVNFLDDSSQTPHLKLTAIDQAFGVAESTGQGKAKAIRDLLKIRQFDFHWMLRRRIEESPMPWLIQVNGLMRDARHLPREVQEEAYRKGLIPYPPAENSEEPMEADPAVEEPASEDAPGDISTSAAADTACLVGEMHLRQGAYEKAIEAFSRAIENNPS